ncbi:MAG TPA: response regulator [Hyphomicrobiales bacterium]|jgi:DNA-binding NtrC family response regulator
MTAADPLRGANVLLLEDDPVQALELITSLADVGALVVGPYAAVEEAQQAILDTHCDAAIIDLRLGHRNSSGFARFLESKHIPFVIFSAYPDSAHLRLAEGAWLFIQKPADADRVVGILSDLVARQKGAD